jgi:hypothetical protein
VEEDNPALLSPIALVFASLSDGEKSGVVADACMIVCFGKHRTPIFRHHKTFNQK